MRNLSDLDLARGLLEAAPDALLGVDQDGRIILANIQAERVFGYEHDELVGRPVEILIPERFHFIHPAHRQQYIDDPRVRPMGAGLELYGRRVDGSEFPAEISLSYFPTQNGTVVMTAVRDITDRKAMEEERAKLEMDLARSQMEARLLQAQRLESLGQLAGGVAHDFNNLLVVILNYAEFASRAVADRSEVVADVQEIIKAAEQASHLTHQLLAFGRRERVQPKVLDLNAVVAHVQQLLRRTIGEQVNLHTDLDGNLWRTRVDPGQVEQVLVNLAVNARDAMVDGGDLTIATVNYEDYADGPFKHPELQPGRYVCLSVSDTGVGMPPEVQERAFEPFFTTKAKGSGLGLATVYGIAHQAGGGVYIYSEPGLGTTIRVYFPAAWPDMEEVDTPAPPDGPTQALAARILVVEDEEAVRRMTARILREAGYEVEATEGGPTALASAQALKEAGECFDLLLTDVVMPNMNGKELSERMRRIFPDIRVVMMSGYSKGVLGDEDMSILEKPFNEKQLLIKVREELGNGRP